MMLRFSEVKSRMLDKFIKKFRKEFKKEFGKETKIIIGKTIIIEDRKLTPIFEISVVLSTKICLGAVIPLALHVVDSSGERIFFL